MSSAPVHVTARERVRGELTREIKDVARAQLAEHGSTGLSLRAIARELGMVSSAIYRYFPSRDELLTALIIDAYQDVAASAEQAEAAIPRKDRLGRWLATVHAVRRWARGQPQEYALIFGSPIPGYRAPQDTIDPAARIPWLLLQILAEAPPAGGADASAQQDDVPLPAAVLTDLTSLRSQLDEAMQETLDESALARGVMAWTHVIGTISFELFGHLHNVIHDYEAFFDHQMREMAAINGITGTSRPCSPKPPPRRAMPGPDGGSSEHGRSGGAG